MKSMIIMAIAGVLLGSLPTVQADEVNVYSARHYDSDDVLFRRFEAETGIKVKVVEARADALVERLRREGDRSPADVFITVDAGRLRNAESFFSPVESPTLIKQVPESLRHPDNLWLG